MNLDLLGVFEAVARTGSFTRAARELGVPKSSVSRGLVRLEASLGVQLVLRTTRKVALTAAGTGLYDRMGPLLRSMRAALGELPEREEEEPSGSLRVTAPVDVGVLFLAEVVARYAARYPAVTVDLHLTGRVVDLVAEGFDVALRIAPRLEDSSLVSRRAAPIAMQVFASPLYLARRGTPRTEAELAEHDWVGFRPANRGRARSAVPGKSRVTCDDLLFLRDAVRAGVGLGMLPAYVAEPEVLAGTLVRVLPRYERFAGHLHIVTPAAKHVPRRVTAFRDLVLELLRTRVASASGR